MSVKTYLPVLLLAVLAILAFLIFWPQRSEEARTGHHDGKPPPVFEGEIPVPVIQRIRINPEKRLEVFWSFDGAAEAGLRSFALQIWNEPAGTWTDVSPELPPGSRAFADPAPKTHGERYDYRVVARARDGTELPSDYVRTTYRDRPVPAAPSGLRADWTLADADAGVRLAWDPVWDPGVEGYMIYSDEKASGKPALVVAAPVREPRYVVPVRNTEERTLTFWVGAIDAFGQEGAPASATCACPAARFPPPEDLHVTATADGMEVRWSHPGAPGLRGFRVYESQIRVAEVGGDARTCLDRLLTPGKRYLYAVEAVSDRGVVSTRVAAEPLDLDLVVPPSALEAEWVRERDVVRIRLHWIARDLGGSVNGYRVEVDHGGGFGPLAEGAPLIAAGETFHTPPAGKGGRFRVRAVGLKDKESAPAEVEVPAPAAFLAPPHLLDYRVVEEGKRQRLVWTWRYSTSAVLGGFRIYLDDKLVADVGPEARSWTSEPLPGAGSYRFEIEAVAFDGSRSDKGPAQTYVARD